MATPIHVKIHQLAEEAQQAYYVGEYKRQLLILDEIASLREDLRFEIGLDEED